MLEFIPASHQYLLTVLSIWWALGQLLGSLVDLSIRSLLMVLADLNLGCMASDCKLLLSHNYPTFSLSEILKPRVAILLVHHGRTHDAPLGNPLFRF